MGQPDGGWYDETPPKIIGASPADKGTEVKAKKVHIYFNEYIKVDNASEKVVISPPQQEQAEIKTQGKSIVVDIKDSLMSNTTYTIDFSDAITDNNEDNPLGNYTYSFSTGKEIDTLEVSGTVLNAEDLEPVKGILVGLYLSSDPVVKGDTIFRTKPFLRVSRTDSEGKFIIRGVAPGEYRCYALQDVDGNYMYTQKSEQVAFDNNIIIPSCGPDTRQDTIWTDSLHIKDIKKVPYTHFYPDNIVMRAFTVANQDRYFLKAERKEATHVDCYFTGAGTKVPTIKLINDNPSTGSGQAFNADHNADPFIVEASAKFDTITYWLRDTALVNTDTLNVVFSYEITDTLGNMVIQTDTTEFLAKVPYAKRLKDQQKKEEEFYKKLEKMRKKGQEIKDSIMPIPRLEPSYKISQSITPDDILRIDFPTPLAKFDSAAIHIYANRDSLWFNAPFKLQHATYPSATDRNWEILADWLPGTEYSFEVDTLAFEDIYGLTSDPFKTGFKVQGLDEFATLFVYVTGVPEVPSSTVPSSKEQVIVQLLGNGDRVEKSAVVVNGEADFFYLKGGNYYLKAIVDRNGNGKWDSGDYDLDQQPEEVFYYPEEIECKEKWDTKRNWNLTSTPLNHQKPAKLIKQKAEKKKTVKNRNAELAKQKGVPPPTR